jgi:hypothetical protein
MSKKKETAVEWFYDMVCKTWQDLDELEKQYLLKLAKDKEKAQMALFYLASTNVSNDNIEYFNKFYLETYE